MGSTEALVMIELIGWVGQVLNCCLYREILEFGEFQKHEGEGAGHGERPLGSD